MKIIYLNIIFILFFARQFNGILITGGLPPLPAAKPDTLNRTRVDSATISSGLDVPWEIIWGPDNKIWITEQKGTVSRIDPVTGKKDIVLKISDVWYVRTAGLLGMALHDDFTRKPYVYLNYTFLKGKSPFSRLVRYTWHQGALKNPKVILEIPGNNGHNGSRLVFWKGKIFWATGDAVTIGNAQNVNSLNGKILRLNPDGSIPHDNPIKGSAVWALGFRNMQGLVFSSAENLYSSEHGDATDDEVNLLRENVNYGWPTVQGFAETPAEISFKQSGNTADPLKSWTPTIAPAGIDYYSSDAIPGWKNSLLMVSLKGKSLRVLNLSSDGKKIINEDVLFENEFGRLRDLCISPAGDVYISTSNRDWNPMGKPTPSDDRIIKITKSAKPALKTISPAAPAIAKKPGAATLYIQYCASCHKEDGKGVAGTFPPLEGSVLVNASHNILIKKVLKGSSGPAIINGVKYDISMPSFTFLTDEEIAGVLTYVRELGSNKSGAINAGMVKDARNSINQ